MMGGRFGGGAEERGGKGDDDGDDDDKGSRRVLVIAPLPAARPEVVEVEVEPARARTRAWAPGEALVACEGRRLLSLRGDA